MDARDYQTAIIWMRVSIRVKPTFSPSHYGLGVALYNVGRIDEAIDEFREVIRLDPGSMSAHFYLGKALAKQHKSKEARHEFEVATEDDNNSDCKQQVRDETDKLKQRIPCAGAATWSARSTRCPAHSPISAVSISL